MVKDNLAAGGRSYANFDGTLASFTSDVKGLRHNLEKDSAYNNMTSDQQNQYLLGIYDQQVDMGLSTKLNTDFVKNASTSQLSHLQRVATNTGMTVTELQKLGEATAAKDAISELTARGQMGDKTAQGMIDAITKMGPAEQKYFLTKMPEFLEKTETYGNSKTAAGVMASKDYANKSEYDFLSKMYDTINAGGNFDVYGNVQQAAQERKEQVRALGAAAVNTMNPISNMSSVAVNRAAAEAKKLKDAPDIGVLGKVEGFFNKAKAIPDDNPLLGRSLEIGSAIVGLMQSIFSLRTALYANTGATVANTMAGLGKGLLTRMGLLATGEGAAVAGGTAVGEGAAVAGGTAVLGTLAIPALAALGTLAAGFVALKSGQTLVNHQNDKNFFGDKEHGGIVHSKAAGWGGNIASQAAMGAAIGSVIPGLGTVAGAIVGASTGVVTSIVEEHWNDIVGAASSAGNFLKEFSGKLLTGVKAFFGKIFHPPAWFKQGEAILETLFPPLALVHQGGNALMSLFHKDKPLSNMDNMQAKMDGRQAQAPNPAQALQQQRDKVVQNANSQHKDTTHDLLSQILNVFTDNHNLSKDQSQTLDKIAKHTKGNVQYFSKA